MSLKKIMQIPAAIAVMAAASVIGSTAAVAAYPDKPIRIIVPYPAGGSVDTLARTLGQKLSEDFKQPIVVENRAGGGSTIGASYVAESEPDGYTLLLGTSAALAVNVSLYKNLSYDPIKDFEPVILGAKLPSFVLISSKQNIKTIQELNESLKKLGDSANYATSGNGTPSHLGTELYKRELGLSAVHVPYKGGAPALADMVANRANFMIAIVPESTPFVQSGQLRALAVTSTERLPDYPDLPTVSEIVPGYSLEAWYALVAPAGTPADVVATLNKAVNAALDDEEIAGKLKATGFQLAGGTPEELHELMVSEKAKWKKVIEDAHITAG